MTPPLVSICLPNLNTRPFLEERMETILAQTLNNWEVIVCDSHSDDGSWEFFQKFKSDTRIRLYQVPREGLYAGWNECLRRTTGRYVYFATSDDTMDSHCLEKLVTPLERLPELKVAVCDFQEIDAQSLPTKGFYRPQREFLGDWLTTPSVRNGKTEFLLHAAFGTTLWGTMASVLFRKELLNTIGLFRTDLGSRADEEWALRASLVSDIAFIPGKWTTLRIHPAQATRHWTSQRQAERWLLDAVLSVIRDPSSGIPQPWKQIPNWASEITAFHTQLYNHTFKLFRWEAKRHPQTFFTDFVDAVWCNPRWVVTQALCGFGWHETREIDPQRHAQRLLEIFQAEWPPKVLQGS